MSNWFVKALVYAAFAVALTGCATVAPTATGPGGATTSGQPQSTAAGGNTGGNTGGNNGGTGGQPVQPGATVDSCGLLTDEEISAATGQTVNTRTKSTLTQVFPSVCDISLGDSLSSLTVSILPTGGRAMYETSFEPFIGEGGVAPLDEALTGLGDKAGRSGDDQIMVLKDDVLFDVFYIHFGQPDKLRIVRYLAERILARLPCLATGCPDLPIPPVPTAGPPSAAPTGQSIDPGSLPSTGARARVVNFYSENGQPVTVDVYAYTWSESNMSEIGALVATVPYAQASDWFSPGLVTSTSGGDPYTRIDVFRQGESGFSPLVSVGEFLGDPQTVATIAVWQEELFEGQPGAWQQVIYAAHPDYEVPAPLPDKGLLVSRDVGMRASGEAPTMYASVGNGCLESPIERSIPDIPNVQAINSDLMLPVGDDTLTVHGAPAIGELPTCKTKPLGPGAPISVAAGDRWLAFPYQLPGASDVSLLVMPFSAP